MINGFWGIQNGNLVCSHMLKNIAYFFFNFDKGTCTANKLKQRPEKTSQA